MLNRVAHPAHLLLVAHPAHLLLAAHLAHLVHLVGAKIDIIVAALLVALLAQLDLPAQLDPKVLKVLKAQEGMLVLKAPSVPKAPLALKAPKVSKEFQDLKV